MAEKKIADKEEVLEYLTNVIRDDEAEERSRLKASEQLGKYLGMSEKKLSISGTAAVTIIDDIGE